jgi:hypothetical protein
VELVVKRRTDEFRREPVVEDRIVHCCSSGLERKACGDAI